VNNRFLSKIFLFEDIHTRKLQRQNNNILEGK